MKKPGTFWAIPQSCCGISDFRRYVVKDYWFLGTDIGDSAFGYPEDGGSKLLKTSMLYYKPTRRQVPEDCSLQRLSFSEKGFWLKSFFTWHLRVIPAVCLRLKSTSFGAILQLDCTLQLKVTSLRINPNVSWCLWNHISSVQPCKQATRCNNFFVY